MSDDTLYMVWRDLDPKYPTNMKLLDAIAQYRDARDADCNVVLVHPETARALTDGWQGITLRERSDIQRNHFYVGVE